MIQNLVGRAEIPGYSDKNWLHDMEKGGLDIKQNTFSE